MSNRRIVAVPEEYRPVWEARRDEIRTRLDEFRNVPPEEYFFELLYCLLTPQSKAAHADIVIRKIRALGFPQNEIDPVPLLRDPAHYIRFHHRKSMRILRLREQWKEIEPILAAPGISAAAKREWLAASINGLGWKEASHFLRNIGHLELAIIDRHILKHLLRCGAIDKIPKTITRRRYLELEERFRGLAESFGLTLQELDLLFWSIEEGNVRK